MVVYVLIRILDALKWLVLIRALLSWFVPPTSDNAFARIIRRITDPILRPFEEMVPGATGHMLAPMLAFLAITLFQMVLGRLLF